MTGWAVLAAALSGVAVWGLVPAPSRRLLLTGGSVPATSWPRWLVGRDGAPPLRRRALGGLGLGVLVGVALGWQVGSGPLGAVAAIVVAGVLTVVGGQRESAEQRRGRLLLVQELPQAYELMAACLDAGLTPRTSLTIVTDAVGGPVGALLRVVLTRMELGDAESTAWRSLAEHPVLGRAARDLARSAEHGLPVAEVLLAQAHQARDQRRAAQEEAAKAVGVKAVLPLMCCYLPAFFAVGIVPIVAGALFGILDGFG